MSEEDIFPTFDPFGPLKDVAIIRDKHTGLHRGCAFVTYWSAADAERAQEALHDKFTFPGARRPAQVKPAEPQRKCGTAIILLHFGGPFPHQVSPVLLK
jgi:CUG-BP- and ETR3-like factor